MTLAQLRDRIMQKLGLYDVGKNLSAEDAEFVENVITEAQDELDRLGVATWVISDVPDYAVSGFAKYVAGDIMPAFGFPLDPALKEYGLNELRRVTQDRETPTGAATYY